MGKINEYQRQQLASSAAGVAQPDKSGQIVGASIEKFGVDMVSQARTNDRLDTITANPLVVQFGVALQKVATTTQAEMAGNPEGYTDRLIENQNSLYENYVGKIAAPGVREKFTTSAQTMMRAAGAAAPKWEQAKRVDAEIAMETFIKGGTALLSNSANIAEFESNLATLEEGALEKADIRDENGKLLISRFNSEQFVEKQGADGLKSFMAVQTRMFPDRTKKDIEQGKYDKVKYYTPAIGETYITACNSRMKALETEATQDQTEKYADILLKMASDVPGSFNMAEVDYLHGNRHTDVANSITSAQKRKILETFVSATTDRTKDLKKTSEWAARYVQAIENTFDDAIDKAVALDSLAGVFADGRITFDEFKFLTKFGEDLSLQEATKQRWVLYQAVNQVQAYGAQLFNNYTDNYNAQAGYLSELMHDSMNGGHAAVSAERLMKKMARDKVVGKNPNLAGTEDPVGDTYSMDAEAYLKKVGKEVNQKSVDNIVNQLRAMDAQNNGSGK